MRLYAEKKPLSCLLKGIPVSEGIAIGEIWLIRSLWDEINDTALTDKQIESELDRYSSALEEVESQLSNCRRHIQKDIGDEEASIFDAHIHILKDPFFQEDIPDRIRTEKHNVESLLKSGTEDIKNKFLNMTNDFFRHRVDDFQDVANRLLRVLLKTEDFGTTLKKPAVIVAHHLTPSDTARFDRGKILGFATELGGKTSHVSILARSMGLPAVVGVERLIRRIRPGDTTVVDGNTGMVHINPTEKVQSGYVKRKQQYAVYRKRLSKDINLPTVTADGVEISLQANVSMMPDVSLAALYKSDGIGLFRTELPFLTAGKLLGEEEQLKIYKAIVESMPGKTVTIRTLDLGGDKFLPFQDVQNELNPFMGWRSIRIFLQEKDVFKAQLRAIFRSSAFGKVRVMFPMISSVEEIIEINDIVEETKNELLRERIPFNEDIPVGIMVEVPSAAIMAGEYISHTDFFSIGTNDLIQYTLAVDRNNVKVARFYQPLNPAILRLVQQTIQAAATAGKSVSVCGEMAGNPLYTGMFLGFGLRQFSMSPLMLPEMKERIRVVTIEECEALSRRVLSSYQSEDIEKILWNFHREVNSRQTVPYLEKVK